MFTCGLLKAGRLKNILISGLTSTPNTIYKKIELAKITICGSNI